MKKISLALLGVCCLSAALTDCGGGGSTPPMPTPTLAATAKPTTAPTTAPSGTPSATPAPTASPAQTASPTPSPVATATPTIAPSPTPTASPTAVPLALRVIGGAPTTATVAQLQSAGRTAASARRAQSAQGVANGLPILVESSGMVAAWAGDVGVWTTNAQTQANIPETGLTVTPSGNLPINNPGPQPLSCLGALSGVCVVHPTAWTFGTSSANGKPVGQQTITVTFADGTSGATVDDVYDGWFTQTCATGWAYQSGVPTATTTKAASDVYVDCANGNVVFPKGAILYSNPIADQYGNYATAIPTVTAAILLSSLIVNVPMASIAPGQIYGVQLQDGGVAKVYMSSQANPVGGIILEGMSLHAKPDGTYAF